MENENGLKAERDPAESKGFGGGVVLGVVVGIGLFLMTVQLLYWAK
jgi:hypothetical protein